MWFGASTGLLSHYASLKIKTLDIVNYTHYHYRVMRRYLRAGATVIRMRIKAHE
jgi:hypothetical protein